MAEIKVSQLPEASGINDADLLMIVQGGVNKKITKENCQFASGDEIYVGDEEPAGGYEDSVKLVIEPSEDTIDISGSEITNVYSDAQDKAYSCNYINNAINPLQIYGVETKIGKWFNKDLYRQCFEITYTGGNVKILDFNYGQYVKSMKSMLVRTDGYCSEISWNLPSAGVSDFGILYVNYQNNAIMFYSSFTGTIYLTIEYTKN